MIDGPRIEDIVRQQVLAKLNLRVGDAEYRSWQNSLGRAMYHVLNTDVIPDDAGVAVEYRLNGRKFRIDFMISGKSALGEESLVIIELKQWSEVELSDLPDHVRTFIGGAVREERHPSYQAWSYSSHLGNYNEYVYERNVRVIACAYLHNCMDEKIISNSLYENELVKAPVFIKGQSQFLREYIHKAISTGTGVSLLERIDSSPMRPSQQLADAVGSMLIGNDEFVLLDEQKTVLEKIIKAARESIKGKKRVLIVTGGPGTGKSVISINALARLTAERMNAKYVTPNSAPRAVYEAKLKGTFKKVAINDLFSGSASFTTTDKDAFDVLIVDEAHRLKKSIRFTPFGENQIKELIESSRTSVFFIDEAQKVTWSDIGEISTIEGFAQVAGAEVERLELTSQFRCGGSDDYLAWLDDTLGVRPVPENYFSQEHFDFKIIDSPADLHRIIREKNKSNNRSRMVAGYCWDWISKRDKRLKDIAISKDNYRATWNLTEDGMTWIISPESVEEVGCIHTCQGLELDYVGVIIGPDLKIENGRLVTDPSARAATDKSLAGYKKEMKVDSIVASLKADEIIRNTYRTLLSRGMKGCYVYFTEKSVEEYFKEHLPN